MLAWVRQLIRDVGGKAVNALGERGGKVGFLVVGFLVDGPINDFQASGVTFGQDFGRRARKSGVQTPGASVGAIVLLATRMLKLGAIHCVNR